MDAIDQIQYVAAMFDLFGMIDAKEDKMPKMDYVLSLEHSDPRIPHTCFKQFGGTFTRKESKFCWRLTEKFRVLMALNRLRIHVQLKKDMINYCMETFDECNSSNMIRIASMYVAAENKVWGHLPEDIANDLGL